MVVKGGLNVDVSSGVLPYSDAALRCAAQKLVAGGPHQFNIACFGTSVTAGGMKRASRYPAQLQGHLRQRFPRSSIEVKSFGYPGSSAQYMHACVDRLLPTHGTDLYIVELADNFISGRAQSLAALSALTDIVHSLRERVAAGGRPAAVAILAPFPQSCSKRLARIGPFQSLPTDATSMHRLVESCFDANSTLPGIMEAFASREHVGGVSVRHAMAAALRATTSRGDAPAAVAATRKLAAIRAFFLTFLNRDYVHPNAIGYGIIANSVIEMIARAAAAATPSDCAASTLTPSSMLSPRAPAARPSPHRRVCAFGEALHSHVLSARGWSYRTLSPPYRPWPLPT